MADQPPANTSQNGASSSASGSSRVTSIHDLLSPNNDPAVPVPGFTFVTRLAPELLREIFSHFEHPYLDKNKLCVLNLDVKLPEDDFKALANSRLVCSMFNRVATPLLLPILRIQTDEMSLGRVRNIAGNPLLSSGIRGIQILMSCRLRSFATQKRHYLVYHQASLTSMLEGYSADVELGFPQVAPTHLDASSPGATRGRACLRAIDRLLGDDAPLPALMAFPGLFDEGFPQHMPGLVEPDLMDHYTQVINECYMDYRAEYERDYVVVSEGSLVSALAQLASTPNRQVSLSFSETPQEYPPQRTRKAEQIFSSMDETMWWLKRTIRPSEVYMYPRYMQHVDMAPYCAMFSELPIAIRQTGSSLNSLEFSGPLISSRNTILCPGGGSNAADALMMKQLQAALQDLQAFVLPNLYVVPPRDEDQETPGGISMAQYISAALSSRHLRKIDLNPSESEEEAFLNEDPGPIDFGTCLSQMRCRNLREVMLLNIQFTEEELTAFCRIVSPEIELLGLTGIDLTQGSWIPILDLLRNLLGERCARQECELLVADLRGSEMDEALEHLGLTPEWMNGQILLDFVKRILGYIRGEGDDENPLANLVSPQSP
ncbi:unnamed protein product [Clonostachys rosea]|uniref:F-box domain-containing protein n=1 Tax=Bionectria ochroleuca TaxID=29856 RepID=A0ABY6UH74_BIOOC|nr:unnamed protein product [Clonostachys rosea]